MAIFATACVLIAAFVLDCIIGDPQNPLHPMRIIGKGVDSGIKVFKKLKNETPTSSFIMGFILVLLVVGLTYIVTRFLTWGFYQVNTWLGLAVEAVICYFAIAPKALKDESMKVITH